MSEFAILVSVSAIFISVNFKSLHSETNYWEPRPHLETKWSHKDFFLLEREPSQIIGKVKPKTPKTSSKMLNYNQQKKSAATTALLPVLKKRLINSIVFNTGTASYRYQ